MQQSKTILISPLNWGLGHAVRDIPLIHNLLASNFKVVVATEGASAELLKKEFPQLQHLELKSFKISYPKNKAFVLKMFLQIPKILSGIRKEHQQLKKIINKYNIDLIISDNRFGVYSKGIPSIFISHQISIQLPNKIKLLEKIVYKLQQKRINKFNKCLIPDYSGATNLSGKLSHQYKLSKKYKYIGILSQFDKKKEVNAKYLYDILIILSGPEPQRSILEKTIFKQIKDTKKKVLIVSGKPESEFIQENNNLKIVNHLSRKEMQNAIISSKVIISRAGYTTIMDLVKLHKKAILIPTIGQTEQEYLAEYLYIKHLFIFRNQNYFTIDEAVISLENLKADFSIFEDAEYEDFVKIIKTSFSPDFLNAEKCETKKDRKSH